MGVIVEKKMGSFVYVGDEFLFIDLFGIYVLDSGNDSNSIDELIVLCVVLMYFVDVIINVVDVMCFECSLYMML